MGWAKQCVVFFTSSCTIFTLDIDQDIIRLSRLLRMISPDDLNIPSSIFTNMVEMCIAMF